MRREPFSNRNGDEKQTRKTNNDSNKQLQKRRGPGARAGKEVNWSHAAQRRSASAALRVTHSASAAHRPPSRLVVIC